MKQLDAADLDRLPGIRIREGEAFQFRCHPGIGCFNRCCRHLNLFLYPYDVIRLRARLGLTSDEFLDRHVRKYKGHLEVPVSFIGSIAFHFKPILLAAMHERDIRPGRFVHKPIEALADFHRGTM